MNSLLDFDYSPWFIVLCIALGVGYSYIQYQKKTPWSIYVNRALAIVRAVLVTILAVLLLGPTVRAIENFFEKPLLVIALDNSESLALATDSLSLAQLKVDLGGLEASLTNGGWDVKFYDLESNEQMLDSVKFDYPRSDITSMVKSIQTEYEGANLAGFMLVSDGIFNSGFSPDLISTFTPIYGIGIGDTIPKRDLSIINLRHNKTVYQDNTFPVEIAIRNEGIGPEQVTLRIYQVNKLVDQVSLSFTPDMRLLNHRFLLKATDPGKQRITIQLDSVTNEATTVNNSSSFFIDVIEGQQRVLIVADAPSPDIKALRLAIEQNEHFHVDVTIAKPVKESDYDLVIFAESPIRGANLSNYQELAGSEIPKLYLLGSRSDFGIVSRDYKVGFRSSGGSSDFVTAVLNSEFKGFITSLGTEEWLEKIPPLPVPFGRFSLQPTDEILLYQKIGSVNTSKPLIYFSGSEPKFGVIMGDGLWKWRMNEFSRYNETARFDELITKTVMYLAAKPDKRQFKLYPSKSDYEVGEDIVFISETYNELFEPIYGEEVHLKIRSSNGIKNYTFTPLEGSDRMTVDLLDMGIYNYTAYTDLNGKRHQVSGQISVTKPDLEAADLTADFVAMSKLSMESGGRFYTQDKFSDLTSDFESLDAPEIIHSQERELLLLNLPWILVLLILMVSGEWLTRKMMGGY